MPEKTLRITLPELSRIRLVCLDASCGGSLELATEKLDGVRQQLACPQCGTPFRGPVAGKPDDFDALARAYRGLLGVSGRVGIEFVIPEKSGTNP